MIEEVRRTPVVSGENEERAPALVSLECDPLIQLANELICLHERSETTVVVAAVRILVRVTQADE